ncbi:MAG: peptidyl-prolyl cis-trans isomerase, partial [Sulfurimonas sp.]|nr:peptidyl-prolyl cis-trans isomerase [Sulfurimonas sp.]
MYKIFLALVLGALLNAEVVNGVAIVVKGEAITLHEIREEMRLSKVDAKTAADNLVRKKLEEAEVLEKKISVSSAEVYDDIKKTAARNNMGVS